jgi:hypothetical protein
MLGEFVLLLTNSWFGTKAMVSFALLYKQHYSYDRQFILFWFCYVQATLLSQLYILIIHLDSKID